MDFKQNYFEIFQIDLSFQVDLDALAVAYRELQKNVHPDKFVSATDQEKRLSAQWTAQINEAYNTLKKPLPRAIYILKLRDVSIEHNPSLDPAFLMGQIELREELEELEAEGEAAMPRLDEYKLQIKKILQGYEVAFGEQMLNPEAEQIVYKMQFVNKLLIAADHLEEKLLDY